MEHVKETDLFKRINIQLLEKNSKHMEFLKERTSLLANIEVDNSGLVRGFIEYFYDNPKELAKTVEYIKNSKGFKVLQDIRELVEDGASLDEISKEVGVDKEILESLLKESVKEE